MIAPSPNCFSMAATVFRSSALDSSTPVGLVPDGLAGFLDDLSDLLSDLAIRVLLAAGFSVAGCAGRLICGDWLRRLACGDGDHEKTLYLIEVTGLQGGRESGEQAARSKLARSSGRGSGCVHSLSTPM